MNVVVLNTQIPFCYGGAEVLAEDLQQALQERGHNATIVTFPFKWYPQQSLLDGIMSCKMMDLSEFNGVTVDKLIALKFPLWYAPHPNKSLWILHQHRQTYDLWDNEYNDLQFMPDGYRIRDLIVREDNRAISDCKHVYTISKNVSERLASYNQLPSGVLYPPPRSMESFYCQEYGDFFFFPSRITPLKRQELVIEALSHTSPDVKVVFAGQADDDSYLQTLKERALELEVADRIEWLGHISEQEKFDLYARCAMVIFPAVNEDYGYITPEAMLSSKGVVTLDDSGGSLEFVIDGENGSVVPPDAQKLGEELERLYHDKAALKRLGDNARSRVTSMDISWDLIVDSLLQE